MVRRKGFVGELMAGEVTTIGGLGPYAAELKALLDAEGTPHCYQCSRCTSACPSALATGTFNPRKIILEVLLGERPRMTPEDPVWMCVNCHCCEEACPKEIHVAGIMNALRNEGFKDGKAHKGYIANAGLLLASGLVANPQGIDRARSQVGLGKMRMPDIEQIRKMLEGTRLKAKGGGK
jgi:heterodisulfide reductase subunit C